MKAAVRQVDIIGILGREIAKTAIDPVVSKQAIQAIAALEKHQRADAIRMLLNPGNLMTLAPVFPTVMRVVRDSYLELDPSLQTHVDKTLCDMYAQQSPLLSVEVNLAYYLQTLAARQTQRKEEVLGELFETTASPLIRRLIILSMAKWECHYWLSDVKNKYGAMSLFEKRAFILASYFLGDEGRHWRDHTKVTWQPGEVVVRDWFSKRLESNRSVPV